MSCERFAVVLMELAREQPVEAELRERALAHAEACEHCAARLATEQIVTAELRALAASSEGEGAPARIEEALRAEFAAPRTARVLPRRWFRAAAAAAALLLIAGGAALLHGPTPTPAPAAREIATDFIPLLYTDAADAAEPRQLVRVELPRTALVSLGLPVNPERAFETVKADVILGYDGLPRAIRFVH